MKSDRLVAALLLLETNGSLSSRELAKRLAVSERTVRRDLEALSAAGIPVFLVPGPQGGCRLDPNWRSHAATLHIPELRNLILPAPLERPLLAAAAGQTQGGVSSVPPAAPRPSPLRQRLHVDTTSWRGAENLSILPVVQDAVWRDRKLSMRYRLPGGELVERIVDPLGLVAKGNTWYLFARRSEEFRTYRVSRIEEAVVLDEPSERPPDFDLAAAWKTSSEQFQDEVTREIEAQARAAAERQEAERRAAREMEIARQVQARLFPQTLPALSTLEYAGICIQARAVGGDYYDFLELGQERFGLVIGDIAGKGIAAALLMANLQANLRSQCAIALDHPQRLLRSVNRLFYENTAESAYATLFFAEYDDARRRLRYANCGHLSALLLRAGDTIERLDSTCTVLGLFREWDCAIDERRLFPGDVLALYTDGVTESFDGNHEEYGEQRLIDALLRGRELAPEALLASIVDEVRRFSANGEQHDDITLIVARCR